MKRSFALFAIVCALSALSHSQVSVYISPTSTTMARGASKQFKATVSGTTNTKVTWLVNGMQGGNYTVGTISSNGLYTAPFCSSYASVTVTARSYYDTSKYAKAGVTFSGTTLTGTNYFVSNSGSDANNGSACHPWATLQHAANYAHAGTTVRVLPGTYTQSTLTLNNSGYSTARIRFMSSQLWGAKIRSGSYTVVSINGAYVDFIGFDVAGGWGTCLGIANWASNTRVISNHVHNILAPGSVCGSNGGSGIVDANYSASNDDIIGNVVHDLGSWPTMDQRVHCIYHSNRGGHILNNIAFRCAGFGIHLWHAATGTVVSSNTVFEGVYGGIYIGDGDAPGGTYASNMLVTNNIVYANNEYSIIEYGNIGSGNRYYNNLLYRNGWGDRLWIKSSSTQSGTRVADPQFVNYTGSITGDYHLKSTSPARDHGTSSGAPTYDIMGGHRPVNYIWDIGAYEYGAGARSWPWM